MSMHVLLGLHMQQRQGVRVFQTAHVNGRHTGGCGCCLQRVVFADREVEHMFVLMASGVQALHVSSQGTRFETIRGESAPQHPTTCALETSDVCIASSVDTNASREDAIVP